jgi:hypothetical protein
VCDQKPRERGGHSTRWAAEPEKINNNKVHFIIVLRPVRVSNFSSGFLNKFLSIVLCDTYGINWNKLLNDLQSRSIIDRNIN